MFKSAYAELEKRARKGRVVVVFAILFLLTAGVLALMLLGIPPLQWVIPLLVLLALCAALLHGRTWSRGILVVLSLTGIGWFAYEFMKLNAAPAEPDLYVGAGMCVLAIILLLLPAVNSFFKWKNMSV